MKYCFVFITEASCSEESDRLSQELCHNVRLEVLTAVTTVWDVMTPSLVDFYQTTWRHITLCQTRFRVLML
jgi:hypothetical protein